MMARQNTIKVSDKEKAELDEVREEIFATSEVPYGVVISKLCQEV